MTTSPSTPTVSKIRFLFWGGYVLVLGCVSAVRFSGLSTAGIVALEFAFLLAGAGWLASSWAARRREAGSGIPWGVVVGAVLLRAVALGGDPGLSDDAYRYVWEGGLVLEGKSPYAFAPDAPERAGERALYPEVHASMNNPEVSAAYPPLMQFTSAVVVGMAGGPGREGGRRALVFLKGAFALCDLLLLVPLLRLLRRRRLPTELLCVWAWSPLVVFAFAGTGHFDALGILFLVLALAAAKPVRAALALAAGVLVKFLPVLALPFLVSKWRDEEHRSNSRGPWLLAALVFVVAVVLGMASPLLLEDGSRGLFAGLSAYASRWESFNLIYRFLEAPLVNWFDDPRRIGRLLIGALWLGFAVLLWMRRRSTTDHGDVTGPVFGVFGAFLVLTPTLHPWYLTWIVPFLALVPSRAWMWLVAVAPLLYWPLERWRAEAIWHEPIWLWPIVALPFWALLLMSGAARRAPR